MIFQNPNLKFERTHSQYALTIRTHGQARPNMLPTFSMLGAY